MRTLFLSILMAFFTFNFLAPEAEAKRLGGGASFGKSYSAPKKVAPAQKQAPVQNATNAAPKKSGMMGGMLGGLLAGGLLGALLFGGAFDGIQFMDILLIGLMAFLAYKLFAMMKQKQPQPQYAGQPLYRETREPVESVQQPQHFTPMSAAATQLSEPDLVLPQWFNKVSFLSGAREHFTTLQAAWDRQDWAEIETYTSPELLEQLIAERGKYAADQHTDVVSVMAELINFIDNKDHVVASIHFYGWIKEAESEQPSEFSEIWHLTRDMNTGNAHWFIVGIEQP